MNTSLFISATTRTTSIFMCQIARIIENFEETNLTKRFQTFHWGYEGTGDRYPQVIELWSPGEKGRNCLDVYDIFVKYPQIMPFSPYSAPSPNVSSTQDREYDRGERFYHINAGCKSDYIRKHTEQQGGKMIPWEWVSMRKVHGLGPCQDRMRGSIDE